MYTTGLNSTVKLIALTGLIFVACKFSANSQDTISRRLMLSVPFVELPDNTQLPHYYPSMNQALHYSLDFYELGYWGIDELGNRVIKSSSPLHFANSAFKYIIGLAFAKYGSELPIPLGVWGHEEYHRSVLGNFDISSKNGNWLFTRWDGTVFGVSDEELINLKKNDLSGLLYAYTSGIQYEVDLNRKIVINDFYNRRTHYKNALVLYNAWYVFDYFRFSVSDQSDSVKVIAPDHESIDPVERDFAGADLTAWIYDMFNPELPFNSRDAFPEGHGVNRRIGISDLSDDARDYLKRQKNLSLLNFINPSIFFINRIKVNDAFSFNLFTQYAPTHFGNDIALYVPIKYQNKNLLINLHRYSNKQNTGMGLGIGIYKLKLNRKIESDLQINIWNQPKSFFSNDKITGGYINFESRYALSDDFSLFVGLDGKTKGWLIGEPALNNDFSVVAGLNFTLKEREIQ